MSYSRPPPAPLPHGGGLRHTEVVTLDVAAVDIDRGTAPVIGRGDKVRVVYLPADSLALLEGWLKHRGDLEAGALFWRVARTGRLNPIAPAPSSGSG